MFALKLTPIDEQDSDKIMHTFFDWERRFETARQDLRKIDEIHAWEDYFLITA